MKRIWEKETYALLYKTLVKNFQEYASWETKSYPKNRDNYNNFCNAFATSIGAKSGDAVKNQIAWATTTQDNVVDSHINVFLDNKTAAFKAGFITKKYIPSTFLCEYE